VLLCGWSIKSHSSVYGGVVKSNWERKVQLRVVVWLCGCVVKSNSEW